ncbi:alpha-(1,3)-fucosyltransferase 10 [Parasteatoda tepidariorum]|uniref:alpha-(1,3)-fucosyltransferase 10 n=1 Tax=Parasteatoda tepidariorum TaxID=114398 RepID=UPI00077F9103|nr:alpha-(1,3)-fucosyltransferase 10 [Parasteatoda tepidariorum]
MIFRYPKRRFRYKIAILIVGIVVVFYVGIIILNLVEETEEDLTFHIQQDPPSSKSYPILIWWTPFTGDSGSYKKCGKHWCYFTDQRKFSSDPLTKGFLFYGSDFKPTDLPLPRDAHYDWALLHEESPKNNFLLSMEKVLRMFNHTATFRRHSDLPLTFQYLEGIDSIVSKKYFIPTAAKNEKAKHLAPIVYLHSDCNTPSERDSYVEELAKYIPVDSYGKCLQNKHLPPHLSDSMTSMVSDDLFEILAQYKFHLAIENAVCDDYITEKLWRPLTVGSVPIYFGSPVIEDWLPNPNSAILLKNFKNPKELANYLLFLHKNDTAYDQHLEHKTKGLVSNNKLTEALSLREWGINNDPKRKNFIDCFECMVCKRVAANFQREQNGLPPLSYEATFEHYGCPKPVPPFTLKSDTDGWWPELYNKAVYEANALENLISKGANFSSTDFYQEVIKLLENSGVR